MLQLSSVEKDTLCTPGVPAGARRHPLAQVFTTKFVNTLPIPGCHRKQFDLDKHVLGGSAQERVKYGCFKLSSTGVEKKSLCGPSWCGAFSVTITYKAPCGTKGLG